MDIRNIDGHVERRKSLLENMEGIHPDNKGLVIGFCNQIEINGISVYRRVSYYRILYYLLQFMGSKNLKETTKEEIASFLEK